MKAFHNDPKIKSKYLKRVQTHFKLDEIIQGATGQDGKGCAVWCTLDKYEHGAYETELGIPRILAKLEDGIFEGLSVEESKTWPAKFLKAITPGADLSKVGPKFLVWLLEDVIQFARAGGKKAIQDVINLYKRQLKGEKIKYNDWSSARSAADAAAYTYAADAAAAAADAAAVAAADAADAAAYTYAADAAAYAAADAAAVAAADAAAAAAAAHIYAAAVADAAAAAAAAYTYAAYAAAVAAAAAYAAAADGKTIKQQQRSKQAKKLLQLLRARK